MSSGHRDDGKLQPDKAAHPARQVHRDRYQGPVRPVETYLHPNTLNDANGLPGLDAGGKNRAAYMDAVHTEHYRKYGHGV